MQAVMLTSLTSKNSLVLRCLTQQEGDEGFDLSLAGPKLHD